MKLPVCLFSIFVGFFFACTTQNTVQIAGSETMLPLIQNAAAEFQKSNPELTFLVTAGGSGHGISQLGKNKIQIGMASRDVTWQEKKKYPNTNFQHHVIAKDAVIPAVSAAILKSGIRALSLRQIGDIYAGKITNWQTLGGPNQDIWVIDTEQDRGTRHIFMARILKDRHAQATGVDTVIASNKERLAAITNSNTAIGMLPRHLLNQTIPGVGITVSGGVVIPIDDNIRNDKFPISRELYLITNGTPTGNLKAFIDFLLSNDGQKIVKKSGFVPL